MDGSVGEKFASVWRSRTTAARRGSSGVTLQGVQMCREIIHSATYIRICIQVAEWMVLQHVRTPPNELRNYPFRNVYTDPYTCYRMGGSATKTISKHEISPNTLQILQ